MKQPQSPYVSPRLDKAAAIAWRLLVVTTLIAVFIFLIIQLRVVVIPFLVALLVAASLSPLTNWFTKKGMKRGLAVAISVISLVIFVGGLLFAFVSQVQSAYPTLKQQFGAVAESTKQMLASEPFNINSTDIESIANGISAYIEEHSEELISGISSAGSTAGHIGAGAILALFAIIFLLYDGKNIWNWAIRIIPTQSRPKFDRAGKKGWKTLTEFVKSQVAVAAVDAVGIGLGALILQVPLAIPIALIVFLGSFIPVVGAIVTGMIAVVLALVFKGWLIALLMLAVILIVQFIEGHVLQPFMIGKAVKLHPLAITFAVASGAFIAGIPGALFAVPIVAVLNTMITHLVSNTDKAGAPNISK